MMKLLGISGTILGDKTAVVVEKVLHEARQCDLDVCVELLDLRGLDLQFCDGREPSLYNEDTRKVIDKVAEADFYVIGFPIFNGSLPAPLKNIFDLIRPSVFRHKVMGFIATGGTYQHYLVIENQVKPIAGFFRSYVAPSYVYVHTDHFNEKSEIVDEGVLQRIHYLAEELIHMQRGLGSPS